MMSDHALESLAKEIEKQGYDPETASRYAVLVGDIRIPDAEGHLVVYAEDGTTVLARLKWTKRFG